MNKCKYCGDQIPVERKTSAKYCSERCYYAAKKQRSIKTYFALKQPFRHLQANEKLLAFFYLLVNKDREFYYQDLAAANFNFNVTTNVVIIEGKICNVINNYAYHIDNETKKLMIWQLNTKY